jgi:O-antigen/teichoic acid export membrane protein
MSSVVHAKDQQSTFARSVGWLAFGEASIRVVQIGAVLVFARVLDAANWNALALALSVYLAALVIASFNLEHSLLFFLPRISLAERNGLLRRTQLLLIVNGLCVFIVCYVVGRMVHRPMATATLTLAGLAVLLELPTEIISAALIADGSPEQAGQWDASQALVQAVCLFAPVVMGYGPVGICVGLVTASCVRAVSGYVVMTRIIGDGPVTMRRGMLLEQLRFCLPLGIALAAGVLTRSLDKWLVAGIRPLDVGMYTVAAQEIPILAVLPYAGGASIARQLMEKVAASDMLGAHKLWWQQARHMTALVVPLTFYVAVIAPDAFALLMPHGYSRVVIPFVVFTLVGLHRVTEYGLVLRAANRNDLVVVSSVVLLMTNVVFGLVGLHLGGLNGLACGSLVAFAVAWIWMLGRLASVFEVSMSRVFPWESWTRNVAVYGLVAVSLLVWVHHASISGGWAIALKSCVFGVAVLVDRRTGESQ